MATTTNDKSLPARTGANKGGAWTEVLADGTDGYVSIASGAAGGIEFAYAASAPADTFRGHPVKTNAGEPLVVPRWEGYTGGLWMRSMGSQMALVVTTK